MERTVASQWLKRAKLLHLQRKVRSNSNGQRGYGTECTCRYGGTAAGRTTIIHSQLCPHLMEKSFVMWNLSFTSALHIAVTTDVAELPPLYVHW